MLEVDHIQRNLGVVGRSEELRKALISLKAGRHLLIEGPVGVGKTLLATAVAGFLGKPIFRVDGDERYTEQKLTGWFDPPAVMKDGYVKEAFLPGPLIQAMKTGGVLFINELNRMPDGVQNVLLPAMDEKIIEVPKLGQIMAKEGFLVVATQNPREFIATSPLSEALRDRFELLILDYQSEEEETTIVKRHTRAQNDELVRLAVAVVRKTRGHKDLRRGASVRAAMSITLLASQIQDDVKESVRQAAHMALPTRIELRPESTRTIREVVDEILEQVLGKTAEGGQAKSGSKNTAINMVKLAQMKPRDLVAMLGGFIDLSNLPAGKIGLAIAENYWRLKYKCKDPDVLFYARRAAVKAIIQRTLELLGPVIMPSQLESHPFKAGVQGEIDLDATYDALTSPSGIESLIIESKQPKKIACAVMLDSSFSMMGGKLALAAAATSVLALRFRTVDYALISFGEQARLLKRMTETAPVEELVEELLDLRATGLTNLSEGLTSGLRQLERARTQHKLGILVTDGNYTVGGDPSGLASAFPRLEVLMMKGYDAKPEFCSGLAALGHGRFLEIGDVEEMPRALYGILRGVAQGTAS